MDDFRGLTTKKFVPSDYCSDGCCKGLKWDCKDTLCYPILTNRIFSCAILKSATLSTILRNATFKVVTPLTYGLAGEKVCIKEVVGVKYKCLGLRNNYSDDPKHPDAILKECLDDEDLCFKPISGPICSCKDSSGYSKKLYNEYISKEKFQKHYCLDAICNTKGCDDESEGIKIKIYHNDVEYYVCDFKVIVKAQLKDCPDKEFLGVFEIPGITKLSDCINLNNLKETGLGLPSPYFYGNLCVPFERDSLIYKKFDGRFKVDCVTRASELYPVYSSSSLENSESDSGESENSESGSSELVNLKSGPNKYKFKADIVLCFRPKETVYTIIKDVIGVKGTLDIECDCDISQPGDNDCCDNHHGCHDSKPCNCGSSDTYDEIED
ncbi:hypothetical protein [Romboutsia sp. 1001216sp1]|uniref:hypothetical protein n=1 Tax=Romboutsia sp. 1001216sp1 TaxID=2986997 RepID=UPI00232DFC28|nr:hypothetical protein [Romboutsia sp. 1001216sp1]MDB8805078.1 hypothetical protein [Romboutsia sp. 1001216sp1]MDB8808068.1 hypothetical protein [Romboutsia sp. 1001216sp1]MDB8810723.1 hypothetical protein [Romboutsia sp. 1001216sp1]MDB8816443.1 hypothetical protein [Romboutsia sp. 1001216sp1]MDB8818603.1 hypothetical protein [Romboutsia sp. 1001216sp1]